MALIANQSGVVTGKFTIPAKVKAGTKLVQFKGALGGNGEATFTGQGTVVTNTQRRVTNVTSAYYDPLAQTFMLNSSRQISGIELFMMAVGDTPVIVQLREVSVGFPTNIILAEGRLLPSQITPNTWTRFLFDTPFYSQPNIEYAVVVLCNDATAACAISELGKFDVANNAWVTSQPYQVGVLLSSANASTWTAHQDKDLTFRLLARKYTEAVRTIELGSVNVTNCTDLLVSALTDNPATGADSSIALTLPDGTVLNTSDGQIVQLGNTITGNIAVKATLRATGTASATLSPGTQIISGSLSASGEYVSRAVDADAAGSKIRVIYDGKIPSGAGVRAYVCGVDAGDAWVEIPVDGAPKPQGSGIYEYQHFITNVLEAKIRVKLVITGSPAARPYLFNLRVAITAMSGT